MRIVIINCFDTIEHRAELLRKVMIGAGHTITVLTSDYRHVHKCKRTEVPDSYEMIPVRPYTKNLSVARLLSHRGFAKAAFKRAEALAPDLLWVMLPPNSLGKYIVKYKRKHPKCKLIFDVIDMWPESLPVTKYKNFPPFTNWAALRNRALSKADMVVSECNLYWEILRRYCSEEKRSTLYLAKEDAAYIPKAELPTDKIALCYLGSVNNIIDIPAIGEIISKIAAESPIEFNIIGDGEKQDVLIETAKNAGAQVIYHGKIYDREEKQKIFDRCHFGLNIMRDTVYVGLTMKSMDYWEGGLPIINTIKGDTWDFVDRLGIGVNYTKATQLPIDQLLEMQKQRLAVRSFFETHFTETIFKEQVTKILKTVQELNERGKQKV